MRVHTLGMTGALLLLAAPASAHISMTSPPPRAIGQLKNAPCGPTTNMRGSQVACFTPGAKVKVTWVETVDHPGHYRIMFDDDGTDAFVDPTSFEDTCTPSSTCLVDGITDKGGGAYEQEITLPSAECDSCTLQLVQVMTDKAPYGNGDDLYYQCADIEIKADCGGTTASTSAAQGATTAKSATSAASGGSGDGGAGGGAGSDEGGGCTVARPGRGMTGHGGASGRAFAGALIFAVGVLGAARGRRMARHNRRQ